ncbi:FIST C-terminal domain-containing protein [Pseudenhygromyxa sp. WMMC2535]|uniref:FIST signal transduction protein n=1 Tax=Pseudenhygromyxa sp. WMMC2535 TaxID=2712867 RepID=UPI001551BB42|nr:FIST C-terminal domain-containing protein [Pseudenhygromyxa sp. WMMC2535]NVB36213.1 FIST C-terminal domain-containing protein [Pseudenhygromyxa sp. WMMC2535]NVB43412.1 FIST C-terminal domain-containing protein [Pseudenhygromyxa sp. WMMC2535]
MPAAAWKHHCPQATAGAIARAAQRLDLRADDCLLALVAEGGDPDLEAIVAALSEAPCPFFGGLFPELLIAGARHREGALLLRVPSLAAPLAVADFDAPEAALASLAAVLPAAGEPPATLFVLVDGLAPGLSRLLEATYDEFGDRVRYWGGGAGTSDFAARPCLFTRAGVFQGGAVLCMSSLHASLGVRHGWHAFRGPLVATRAQGNEVLQLNWRPAFSVYAEHVGEHLGRTVTPDEVFEVTRSYPLGLQRQGREFVVRDPVATRESGALRCVGDVPQNAVLSILHGDPDSLIAAAEQAAREAARADPSADTCYCLIADCISRVFFLGERFAAELEAITRGLGPLAQRCPPLGVATLGEISSRGDGYIELFNKTCVIATLHQP